MKRDREFLIVLIVFACVVFAAGYACGTWDGTKYAVEAYGGRIK